eukprot:s1452_g7.t1
MTLQLPAPRPWPSHPLPRPRHAHVSPGASWGTRWRAGVAVAAAQRLMARRGKLPGTEIQSKAPEGETHEERLNRMLDALGARPACPREGSASALLEKLLLQAGLKAFSCLRAGDGKQAEELFASAVLATAAAPNVDAIYGMGVFLEVSHRHTEMLQWMDLVIELDPRHLDAWEARSRCQEHHGRLAEVPGWGRGVEVTGC